MAQVERVENVDYVVVDNDRLTTEGRKLFPEITFLNSENIDESRLSDANMVILSSVLQYIYGWEDFVEYLLKFRPELLVICRHLSPDSLDYTLLAEQKIETKSGLAGAALIQFIPWKLIKDIMIKNGYRLVSTLVMDNPVLFGKKRDSEYGISERILIFKRQTSEL